MKRYVRKVETVEAETITKETIEKHGRTGVLKYASPGDVLVKPNPVLGEPYVMTARAFDAAYESGKTPDNAAKVNQQAKPTPTK